VVNFEEVAMSADDVLEARELVPAKKVRGPYRLSPRLLKVIELLATNECSSISAACDAAGFERRSFYYAMKRKPVRRFLEERTRAVLGVSQARASERMRELMESENQMTAFNASRFVLGVAGHAPAERPAVSVNLDFRPGYIVDLGGGNRISPMPAGGAVIDATGEVADLDDRRPKVDQDGD
jgi:hypothetical protein